MKIFIAILSLIILPMVLFGCASHEKKLIESKAKYYDQASLEKLFSKKHSASFVTDKGVKGMIYYYPNRTMHVEFNGKNDNGEYFFKAGQLCSTWKTIRKGEKCYRLYEVSSNVFEVVRDNGLYDSTITFLE